MNAQIHGLHSLFFLCYYVESCAESLYVHTLSPSKPADSDSDSYLVQAMEESYRQNRTFMVERRALLQDLQTVSSLHLTALLVVSCPLCLSLWSKGVYGTLHYIYV